MCFDACIIFYRVTPGALTRTACGSVARMIPCREVVRWLTSHWQESIGLGHDVVCAVSSVQAFKGFIDGRNARGVNSIEVVYVSFPASTKRRRTVISTFPNSATATVAHLQCLSGVIPSQRQNEEIAEATVYIRIFDRNPRVHFDPRSPDPVEFTRNPCVSLWKVIR